MALRDFYPLQTPTRVHYCSVCRLKRSIAYREYVLAWQWAQMTLVVIFLTWFFYRMFDFKTLLLILPLYMVYEFNNRIFNLKQLICPRCNFDPIQYKSDPQAAIEVAKQKLTVISQELEIQHPAYAKPKKCPQVAAVTQQAAYKALPSLMENKELQKQLASAQKIPKEIKEKYNQWKAEFLEIGIDEMKKRPGWHDEPLQGNLSGCRSVRLSGQARLIYKPRGPGQVEVLWIDPKHSYAGVCPP